MAIADDVVALLRSPAVQRINFAAEAVKINGHVYNNLAKKIESGQLHVTVDPSALEAGSDGQYDPGTNTLTLPSNTFPTPYSKQVVVHELTHAAIDDMHLPDRRGLHKTEGEGISFIAEHLYVRFVHGAPPGPNEHRIYRVADAIAKNVEAAGAHLYTVPPAEIQKLRNAIGQHSLYRSRRGHLVKSDGI
jgi:hypothetical protein